VTEPEELDNIDHVNAHNMLNRGGSMNTLKNPSEWRNNLGRRVHIDGF
jgi:hypothetical protein